jgi:hypothetical protein
MKTVIEMAQEAGFDYSGVELSWESVICTEELERFAELVRADEREACAKVCDEQAERSKLAMEKSKRTTDHAVYRAGAQTAAWNAAEIRARSNT